MGEAGDAVANYYVDLAGRTGRHPTREVVSGLLGTVSAASFPAAWIALGHLLNAYR